MKELVFWQNCISIHQAPLMRALSSRADVDVTVVADEDIPHQRRAMGWSSADYGSCEVVIGLTSRQRRQTVERLRHADAHFFSGIGSYAGPSHAFQQLTRGPRNHVSIITESWDPRGISALLRTVVYTARVARRARYIDSLLTIGGLAHRQFQKAGISPDVTWPFGYFVDKSVATRTRNEAGPFRVLFVGSMSPLKQPLMLLEALAQLRDRDWELWYVGEGSEVGRVREWAERAGFGDRVAISSFSSNDDVRQQMADSDLLVLPSSYDGWGVVVSESLQGGTRVAVSRAAGASELVRGELQGWTFSPDGPAELAQVIGLAMGRPADRRGLMEWSEAAISPHVAAQYLLDIVNASGTPKAGGTAPWMS